jgi:hypothetical protein
VAENDPVRPARADSTGEHLRLLREDFRDLRGDLKDHASINDGKIEALKSGHAKMIYFVLAGLGTLIIAGIGAMWSLRGDIDEKTPMSMHNEAVNLLDNKKANKEEVTEMKSDIKEVKTILQERQVERRPSRGDR